MEDADEEQRKRIEDRVEKQIQNTDQQSFSYLFSKDFLAGEARHELKKLKRLKKKSIEMI